MELQDARSRARAAHEEQRHNLDVLLIAAGGPAAELLDTFPRFSCLSED